MIELTKEGSHSYVNKYTYIFGFYGFAVAIVHNGLLRRPFMSGIYRHAIFSAFGAGLGSFVGVIVSKRFGKRDFYIEDYIARHPQDFGKPPPKKLKEHFEVWTPVP